MKNVCFTCEKEISYMLDKCPYCGAKQYDDEPVTFGFAFEKPKKQGGFLRSFSDEEILATGLHPQDEGYKMSLISRILGRK